MSADVVNESLFWLSCFVTGILITMLYDVLRILRRVIPHGGFLTSLEDSLFWVFVTILLFLLLYHMNNGTLRWFAVFGLFAGMWIYKKIFGNHIVDFMSTIISYILHLVVRACSVPLKLVKSAFLAALGKVRPPALRLKKQLTGDIKKVKITLCKHNRPEKGKQNES